MVRDGGGEMALGRDDCKSVVVSLLNALIDTQIASYDSMGLQSCKVEDNLTHETSYL